jgi:hypothetical protein
MTLLVVGITMMVVVMTSNINGVVGDGCCYATKGQAYRYQYNSTTSYAGDNEINAQVLVEQVDTANELVGPHIGPFIYLSSSSTCPSSLASGLRTFVLDQLIVTLSLNMKWL